jgi:hypothetical protein
MVFAELSADVRAEFDRYGITASLGEDAYFDTTAAVVEAFATGAHRDDATPTTIPSEPEG